MFSRLGWWDDNSQLEAWWVHLNYTKLAMAATRASCFAESSHNFFLLTRPYEDVRAVLQPMGLLLHKSDIASSRLLLASNVIPGVTCTGVQLSFPYHLGDGGWRYQVLSTKHTFPCNGTKSNIHSQKVFAIKDLIGCFNYMKKWIEWRYYVSDSKVQEFHTCVKTFHATKQIHSTMRSMNKFYKYYIKTIIHVMCTPCTM